MRRWHRIALAALLIALVGVIGWQLRRDREPTYLGKPYSYWLETYSEKATVTSQEQARTAIRQIGTNGLPILLRMISVRDSRWKMEANRFLYRHSPISFRFHYAGIDRGMAISAFLALRKQAIPAVPALIQLLSDRDPSVRHDTATAVALMGSEAKEAVPALVKCFNDANQMARGGAILAVMSIHRMPELAVPALIERLRSHSDVPYAFGALHQFGESAQSAALAVIDVFNDPDLLLRQEATNVLLTIDPKRAAELGVK